MRLDFNIMEHRNPFTVGIDTNKGFGYFEHVTLGEDCAGSLWFQGKTLVDYDGVFQLPDVVSELLTEMGFELPGDLK